MGFIYKNLNSLTKFGIHWPSDTRKIKFLISLMYFRYFIIISPCKRAGQFVFLSPKDALRQVQWNGPVVLGRKNFLFGLCIFAISLLSLLGKESDPSFEQFWIPFTQECFVSTLVEIGLVVLENKIFKILSVYFRYLFIISPWKKSGAHHLNQHKPQSPRMMCGKLSWNWPSGCGEKKDF